MTTADQLSSLGRAGLRLTKNPDGGVAARCVQPLSEDARDWLRVNRDEILTLVADLDRRLALALRVLDGVERKASHRPSTLAVVALYRETVVELRERLDPLACEVDEAARLFAARTFIPAAKIRERSA